MHKQHLIPLIIDYIRNAYAWHQAGAEREIFDGPGLRAIELEEEILTQFGLPPNAYCYSEMLQLEGFSLEDKEKRAEDLYNRLVNEAESYLLSSPQKDTLLLANARKEHRHVGDVLPFLGFSTTAYNTFLFYDIYLSGCCSEVELLQNLKQAESYDIPDQRHIPYKITHPGIEKCFREMKNYGLAFLDEYREYLQYQSAVHPWNVDPLEVLPGIDSIDFDELVLDTFFITHVDVLGTTQCNLELIIPYKSEFRKIKVWCYREITDKILTQARYYSLVSALTLNLECLDDDSYPFEHNALQIAGYNYEISKCVMELERLDTLEENGVQDLFHFSVKSILTLGEILAPFENDTDEFPF